MKLEELHVCNISSSSPSHRYAVTRRNVRIRGVAIHLPLRLVAKEPPSPRTSQSPLAIKHVGTSSDWAAKPQSSWQSDRQHGDLQTP